jgi:hypothetical protein
MLSWLPIGSPTGAAPLYPGPTMTNAVVTHQLAGVQEAGHAAPHLAHYRQLPGLLAGHGLEGVHTAGDVVALQRLLGLLGNPDPDSRSSLRDGPGIGMAVPAGEIGQVRDMPVAVADHDGTPEYHGTVPEAVQLLSAFSADRVERWL